MTCNFFPCTIGDNVVRYRIFKWTRVISYGLPGRSWESGNIIGSFIWREHGIFLGLNWGNKELYRNFDKKFLGTTEVNNRERGKKSEIFKPDQGDMRSPKAAPITYFSYSFHLEVMKRELSSCILLNSLNHPLIHWNC